MKKTQNMTMMTTKERNNMTRNRKSHCQKKKQKKQNTLRGGVLLNLFTWRLKKILMKKMNLYIGSSFSSLCNNATRNDNRENCNHDNATTKKMVGSKNSHCNKKKCWVGVWACWTWIPTHWLFMWQPHVASNDDEEQGEHIGVHRTTHIK